MVNTIKKAKSINKHFNSLRILTIVAIILTIVLTTIILFESGLDGAITQGITTTIKDTINDITGVENRDENLAPTTINFTSKTIFFNTPTPLTINTQPTNASDAFTYKFENLYGDKIDGISIDENNNIVCTLAKQVPNGIFLTITSSLDESVSYRSSINYVVLPADDERIERIEFIIADYWLKTTPTTDEYIKVGKPYYPYCIGIIKDEYLDEMGLTKDDNAVVLKHSKRVNDMNPNHNSSAYLTDEFYVGESMCFYKEASITMTCRLLTKGEPIVITKRLECFIDPDYDYKPTYIRASENSYQNASGRYINGEYVVQFDKNSTTFTISPQRQTGKNTQISVQHYDEHSKECVSIIGGNIKRKVNRGECYLWVVSDVDKSVKQKIKVIFNGDEIKGMRFADNYVAMLNSTIQLHCTFDNIQDIFGGDIRYSIVDGNKYATVTENGFLFGLHLGKVIVRAQCASSPEIFVDMEIEIKLYNNLYYFVRKILGHAFLYAVLGFGFGGVYFLTIKKRWVTAIATPITLFVIGGIGELLQSLNPGRTPAWTDIAIDFVGGMIGFVVAILIVTIVCLIWRKANRKSFDNMLVAFKRLNLLTLFKRANKVFALDTETVAENTQEEVDDIKDNDKTTDCDNITLEEVASDVADNDSIDV